MTPKSSLIRHILYVAAATLTAAYSGLEAVDFSDPKSVIGYVISVSLAGVIASRAYIDTSNSDIPKP